MRHVGPALSLLALAACSQPRLTGLDCHLPLRKLAVEHASDAALGGAGGAPTFADDLSRALAPSPLGGGGAARQELLVLSGGGQWGAFGAGFLNGWKDLPDFKVVTGVSTGSLQGTFALLGNQNVPADRKLAVADDFPPLDPAAARRNREDAAIGYTITREATLLKKRGGGLIGAVRHGSAGDLAPLRERLRIMITPDTLRAVADVAGPRAEAGRRFYVGVVDIDTGEAYAVDMSEIARRVKAPGADATAIRAACDCYIETLIASSSAPLGALPVFIDGHMLVDGGVRFGVFLEEVARSVEVANRRAPVTRSTGPIRVNLIINGDMAISAAPEPRPDKWNLIDLASRSEAVLVDQIYKFSAMRVEDYARQVGAFRFAYVHDQDRHKFDGKTCREWNTIDEADDPLQFHPNFMRCLIDYGRKRAENGQWDKIAP